MHWLAQHCCFYQGCQDGGCVLALHCLQYPDRTLALSARQAGVAMVLVVLAHVAGLQLDVVGQEDGVV
jgi:hypothetical protein